MLKEKEIKIINELAENATYFADQFSKADIDIIKSNIKSDFPFLCGTSIDVELCELRAKDTDKRLAEEQVATLKTELATKEALLHNLMVKCLQYAEGIAYDFFPIEKIVKHKLDNNITLNEYDIDFLKSKI